MVRTPHAGAEGKIQKIDPRWRMKLRMQHMREIMHGADCSTIEWRNDVVGRVVHGMLVAT
ncbi:hypothetical protein A4F85_26585 [Delftia sp. GW456-R20]|nr:hypothetical protein A4F85_26585 [Delftia sp. GW456-R20]